MKHNSFPSREELLLQCNTIKQRQERIIQVRQQSKNMSAAVLERVKREARKQCEEIENHVLSEIRNYHQKELENSRKQYEKCISEINQRHFLQQVQVNNVNSRTTNKKKTRNSSPVKNTARINGDRKVEKPLEEKSAAKPSVQRTGSAKNPNEKLKDEKVEAQSRQTFSHNIVIDSDDEVKKSTMLNFRKHSPEVKHLKSLQSENKVGSRSKCGGKSHCVNGHKFKLMHSKAVNDRVLINNESDKMQMDEMYNHLVHDRIRILEQKDKILDRRTMFLPNAVDVIKKPPRFSEYFARFRSTKTPPTKVVTNQPTTSRSDTGFNEILDDIKRIEMKKKSLRSELTKSNDAHSKTVSSLEEKQNERKQDSSRNSEKAIMNSNSNENSPPSNNSDSSPKKILSRNVLYPSPISKTTQGVDDSSRESDCKKEKSSSKRRPCKRKFRCKDIQVTVCNNRKSIVVNSNDTVVNKKQDNTSSSSASKDFQQSATAPVKLVVNVLPSTDCTIEIRSNAADKRYLNCTARPNAEKVKDWRTLFKNQDKLTESSYYSPPEYSKKIHATSSEENGEQQVSPRFKVTTNDVGYYVRKLLTMSPESVDNLGVSSCDTTSMKDFSKNSSTDSNLVTSAQKSPEQSQFNNTEEHFDDSGNVKKLLLECLRLATAEANNINLTTFKSVDSSCDNKVFDNSFAASELNESDTTCKNFINTAIQRLLPLYQNSLDDNLDFTTQPQRILDRIEDQSEVDESKDDSAFISSSAYLQKFVSSLSGTPEKPNKNQDIVEFLKRYVEPQSSSEKSNKISEDCLDFAENMASKDESCISLPSVDELIRKGLISKAYAASETQNEPKEYLDEEEFIRKMLRTDFTSRESHPKDDSGQKEIDNSGGNHQSEPDERYTTDIREELRRLGLNWMDTTLQRTLQASVINSTSSTEDSAGPLRNNTKFPSNYHSCISSNLTTVQPPQPKLQPREFLNISPIKIPDLQLSVPKCFRKN